MKRCFEFIKTNKLWIIAILCLMIFLQIVFHVLDHDILLWDQSVYQWISHYWISDFLTPVTKFITHFGGVVFILVSTFVIFVVLKQQHMKLLIGMNLIVISFLNLIFKNIFQRPRPEGFRLIDETGFSFPSGHSMVSMAFYGYFIYLIYHYVHHRYIKWILIVLLSILIVLIGISRVYLGVHYMSDVLAGFVFSLMYLILFIKSTHHYLLKEEVQ